MRLEISSFKRIVVLTGAGISAESGISTFRDSGGLWENHRIEDVATPEAFLADPCLVWRFYSMRRHAAVKAAPNAGHRALADFAAQCAQNGIEFTLVTQNVDALHERARTSTPRCDIKLCEVLAMHGTLPHSRCVRCNTQWSDPTAWFNGAGAPLVTTYPEFAALAAGLNPIKPDTTRRDSLQIPMSPCCQARLRPHIVWFGEMPLHMDRIQTRLAECDLFLTIGTSGQVYPASGFLEQAKFAGATTACLNKEPIPQQAMVDFYFEGRATQTVPRIFQTRRV